MCGRLPKNSENARYAISKRGDLANTHRRYAGRGIGDVSRTDEIEYYCSSHTTHRVPGLLAAIPIMYIPIISCVRVIAEKKTTTRFFPRVSAYRL